MRGLALSLVLLWMVLSVKASEQAGPPNWPVVGKATFSWAFWTVYHARLMTPGGRFEPGKAPVALSIDYQLDIDGKDLLEQTGKQWRKLGIDKAQRELWLAELAGVWPDVKEGDNLTFVLYANNGRFYFNQAFLAEIDNTELNRAFIDIWLSPQSEYPKQRRQLIGAKD